MTSILSSGLIEVAIGLAFIYLLLSLFCSIVNEWIAGIFGSRAYNLERGIRSLFTDGELTPQVPLATAIYNHGLIRSLYTPNRWDGVLERFLHRKPGPSYIAPQLFVSTLVNLLLPATEAKTSPAPDTSNRSEGPNNQPPPITVGQPPVATNQPIDAIAHQEKEARAKQAAALVKSLRQGISDLPDSKGKQALMALTNQGQADLEQVRNTLEDWYNDGMDRVAGWYKRRTTVVLFFLGISVAIAVNADSLLIARTLWNNPALRQATVTAADQYIQNNERPATPGGTPPDAKQVKQSLENLNTELSNLQLPVGWPTGTGGPGFWATIGSALSTLFAGQVAAANPDVRAFPPDFASAWFRVLGWFFTAAALSLGAPFWFDLLNKFMVVRSTVKPKEKSQPETSKD